MGRPVRDVVKLNVRSAEPFFKRTHQPGQRNGRVRTVQQAHPTAWKVALGLAGGDCRRVQLEPDGSVLVSNRPRPSY